MVFNLIGGKKKDDNTMMIIIIVVILILLCCSCSCSCLLYFENSKLHSTHVPPHTHSPEEINTSNNK